MVIEHQPKASCSFAFQLDAKLRYYPQLIPVCQYCLFNLKKLNDG
jgi:hypothetical protein